MNFDQIQNWVNGRLTWTCEGNTYMRVFAVPPEWAKVFYGRPVAQAYAYQVIAPEGEIGPSGMSMAGVRIASTGEHNILFQGPWEAPDKAQRRLARLLGSLDGPYIPSLDDLLTIAEGSACTVDV